MEKYPIYYEVANNLSPERTEVVLIDYMVAAILDEGIQNPWIVVDVATGILYSKLKDVKPDSNGHYPITMKLAINLECTFVNELILVIDYSRYQQLPTTGACERIVLYSARKTT